MITDMKTNTDKDARINFNQGNNDNRWEEERRQAPSKGFAYISSVGWIDRRERIRRKDDPYRF